MPPLIFLIVKKFSVVETVLDPLRQALPELRVVMEHITTGDAATYVGAAEHNLAATITTHHLMINRNHILAGGSGRIITACLWPSGKTIAWLCGGRQHGRQPVLSGN